MRKSEVKKENMIMLEEKFRWNTNEMREPRDALGLLTLQSLRGCTWSQRNRVKANLLT